MENNIINLLLDHRTVSGRTSKPISYHTVKTVHSIHVGQKFEDNQAFESAIECYQSAESVQFYKRDSRAVQKAKPCIKKMAELWIELATSCSQVRYTTDWAFGVGSANGCNIYCGIWLNKWSISPFSTVCQQGSRCRSPVAPNAKIFKKWLQNRSTGESTGDK